MAGGEVIDLKKVQDDQLLRTLAALVAPMRAAELEAALLVGNSVLDGLPITQRVAEQATAYEHDEWSPYTPLEFAEVAMFARAYPDLKPWWSELGPTVMFTLSVLSRPELAPLTAGVRVKIPRRRDKRHFRGATGYQVFALVCLIPPAGETPEERHDRYRVRLDALERRYLRALRRAIPLPGMEKEEARDRDLAEWAFDEAWKRMRATG